jgi:hypothetical protein
MREGHVDLHFLADVTIMQEFMFDKHHGHDEDHGR